MTLAAAVALTVSACGNDDTDDAGPGPDIPSIGGPSSAPSSSSTPAPANEAAEQSALTDVEAYAVQLEQVFFGSGYPRDLAGAVKVADRLDLELSPGNRIASYVYDADAEEFRLCVENTSGAFAIYDTQPMSTMQSGPSGGCPGT